MKGARVTLSRRRFLQGASVGSLSLLTPAFLAACMGGDRTAATPTSTPSPAAPGGSPTPAAKRGASKGTITVAENIIPAALDANVGAGGLALMAYGVGETLMRVSADMKIEPWIATKVDQVSARQWRVTLRDDVTFSDGSPCDAAAVKASFELSMEKAPAVAVFLPKGTTFAANGLTLDITTPTDVALMRSNLAAFNLIVQKPGTGGVMLFTGPFVPSNLAPASGMTLTAYPGYRGGPARLEKINVRYVPDVNARVLALQGGDVQAAAALLPAHGKLLKSAGFEVHDFKFTRANQVVLNVKRAPLDDVAVRRAIALTIDRETIVKNVLDGSGRVSRAFVPDDIGLAGIVDTQKTDAAEARRILDAAGWTAGAGGVRAKAGKPLAFKLGFYASRAELEPMAIVIKDQLKAVGIDATIEKFADINTTVADSAFDATLYSYNPVPYGDPGRGVTQFYVSSGTNKDRYANQAVTDLFARYTQAAEPGARQALLEQMQRAFGEDVPVVYVLNPNQIHAFSKKVKGYTPHPLENYKYHAEMSVDA